MARSTLTQTSTLAISMQKAILNTQKESHEATIALPHEVIKQSYINRTSTQ